MVLDASLLNIQHYKVGIKGKMEQYIEKSGTLLYWERKRLLSIDRLLPIEDC